MQPCIKRWHEGIEKRKKGNEKGDGGIKIYSLHHLLLFFVRYVFLPTNRKLRIDRVLARE
jgi:hypothetical protein